MSRRKSHWTLMLDCSEQEMAILKAMQRSGLWGDSVHRTAIRIIDAWFIAHPDELLDLGIDLQHMATKRVSELESSKKES